MKLPLTLLMLTLAAALEVGGDALIRRGLWSAEPLLARLALILGGGVVLAIYGIAVNLPPWDFGRLLGVYVVLFFIIAQVVNWLVFATPPSTPILVGGALSLAGGLVMTFWRAEQNSSEFAHWYKAQRAWRCLGSGRVIRGSIRSSLLSRRHLLQGRRRHADDDIDAPHLDLGHRHARLLRPLGDGGDAILRNPVGDELRCHRLGAQRVDIGGLDIVMARRRAIGHERDRLVLVLLGEVGGGADHLIARRAEGRGHRHEEDRETLPGGLRRAHRAGGDQGKKWESGQPAHDKPFMRLEHYAGCRPWRLRHVNQAGHRPSERSACQISASVAESRPRCRGD